MKYRYLEFIKHCKAHPDIWTEVALMMTIAPDFQVVETPMRIPGLREIKFTDGWPRWAKAAALLKRAGDQGLGDVVSRWARWTLMDRAVKRLTKKCGCQRREMEWNQRFPFEQ